jgi:hypothetical protein
MNNKNDLSALIMVQIIIVLLKIANIAPIASWSWVWVLSIAWIPFVLGIVAVALLKGKSKDLGK